MGIRFVCPNGHKLNVKSQLAGQVGICPECQARVLIPRSADDAGAAPSASTSDAASTDPPTAAQPPVPVSPPPAQSEPETPPAPAPAEPAAEPQAPPVAKPVRAVAKAVARPASPPEPPAAVEWHLRTSTGEQLGPGDAQAFGAWLAEGKVTPDAYVWRAGWADWKLVSDAGAELPVQSPPAEGPPTKSRQPGSAASRYVSDRKRAAKRQKYMALVLLGLVILTAAALVLVLRDRSGGSGPSEPAPPAAAPPAMAPADTDAMQDEPFAPDGEE